MQQLITFLHVLVSICIIGLVLVQQGKGADIGASFGSGSSQTMFGSQGSTPFLVKLTGGLAMTFFITSALLSFIVAKQEHQAHPIAIPSNPVEAAKTMAIPTDASTSKPATTSPIPGSNK